MKNALGASEEAANQIRLQSVVLAGNPAGRIVQYARNNSIDLIVMSTHGRTGIKPWALGSVADKVARASPVPVLLVRGKERPHGIQKRPNPAKAVVPLDGSEESEASIPWVTEMALKLKMQVSLLQVIEVGYRIAPSGYGWVVLAQDQLQSDEAKAKEYLESVRSRLTKDGVAVENVLVKQGDPAEEITGFAAETGGDLIAMSTHGRSGIGRWALGGVASKVLNGSNVPVLLVRAKKR